VHRVERRLHMHCEVLKGKPVHVRHSARLPTMVIAVWQIRASRPPSRRWLRSQGSNEVPSGRVRRMYSAICVSGSPCLPGWPNRREQVRVAEGCRVLSGRQQQVGAELTAVCRSTFS
jgi:hypothetical protein